MMTPSRSSVGSLQRRQESPGQISLLELWGYRLRPFARLEFLLQQTEWSVQFEMKQVEGDSPPGGPQPKTDDEEVWFGKQVASCEAMWQNGSWLEVGHRNGNWGDGRRNGNEFVPASGQTMLLWVWLGRVWRV